jgi:predicted lipid-binding transport protein (Tim44 family)
VKSYTREELDAVSRILEERIAKSKDEPDISDGGILAISLIIGAAAGLFVALFAGGVAFSIAAIFGLTLLQTLGSSILSAMAAGAITLRQVGRWTVKSMRAEREKLRAKTRSDNDV